MVKSIKQENYCKGEDSGSIYLAKNSYDQRLEQDGELVGYWQGCVS